MKKSGAIFNGIKSNNKSEDPEKMDILMKTIKTVHSNATSSEIDSAEDLAHQRNASERFAKLIKPGVGIRREEFTVGDIHCEWLRPFIPHRTDTIILYCHGGGFINGGLGYASVLGGKLLQHTGMEVVIFEYRLSPEHKYPAAINDCISVWDYIMHLGYGAKNVIIAGDSAGGNLALELCFELKENQRLLPKGLVLMSPWTDMRACNNSYKTYAEKDPMLTYEYIVAARNAYAGADADFKDPKLSPLLGDLSNMPPTLIQVGSNEVLRDDSEKLFKYYNKAGSLAKLEICHGGWHVYQQVPGPKASQALDSINEFINRI